MLPTLNRLWPHQGGRWGEAWTSRAHPHRRQVKTNSSSSMDEHRIPHYSRVIFFICSRYSLLKPESIGHWLAIQKLKSLVMGVWVFLPDMVARQPPLSVVWWPSGISSTSKGASTSTNWPNWPTTTGLVCSALRSGQWHNFNLLALVWFLVVGDGTFSLGLHWVL